MTVRFYNIQWDTDGEPTDLPTDVTIEDVDDDIDLAEEGCDVLSDKFGFCLYGFDYMIVA